MTSNMIYIVALGVGFKCQLKIHLNTQCPPPLKKKNGKYKKIDKKHIFTNIFHFKTKLRNFKKTPFSKHQRHSLSAGLVDFCITLPYSKIIW